MVSFDEHSDAFDWRNEPDASAPPTPDEEQQMIEAVSVALAVALLRERGFAVVEPVDVRDGVQS